MIWRSIFIDVEFDFYLSLILIDVELHVATEKRVRQSSPMFIVHVDLTEFYKFLVEFFFLNSVSRKKKLTNENKKQILF